MRSLRFQLIFWNTAILGVALFAVAGTIAFLNLKRLSEGIDRELAMRARNVGGRGGFGGPNGPGPFSGQGQGGLQPRDPNNPEAQNPPRPQPGNTPDEPPQAQGGQPFREQQGRPFFRDAESERIATIRRPRIMDRTGKIVAGPEQDGPFDARALKQFSGVAFYTNVSFMNEPVRVITAPAPSAFPEGSVVQIARELRDYRELERVQLLTLLTVLPVALILAALGGRFLTGRAMRPIADMGRAAGDIGAGQFDRRIPVSGNDEFASLGMEFNRMAESLGLSFQEQREAFLKLEQAYEQQRRFVADASHELRTPLTRLQLVTSGALSDPKGDLRRAVEVADQSAQSMANLVRQLLDLAKADAGELKPLRQLLDMRALVADVADDFSSASNLSIDLPEAPVQAEVDPSLVARALSNLIENAIRYGAGAPIVVSVRNQVGSTELVVADKGPGIAAEHVPHLAERFYRADAAREAGGTGLGLAIVDEIARAHGGTLTIQSEVGKGTWATLSLPETSA